MLSSRSRREGMCVSKPRCSSHHRLPSPRPPVQGCWHPCLLRPPSTLLCLRYRFRVLTCERAACPFPALRDRNKVQPPARQPRQLSGLPFFFPAFEVLPPGLRLIHLP